MADDDKKSTAFEAPMDIETLRLAGVFALSAIGMPTLAVTKEEDDAIIVGQESGLRQSAARELIRRLLALDERRPELGIRGMLQSILTEARRDPDNVDFAKKLAPIVVSMRPYLEAM